MKAIVIAESVEGAQGLCSGAKSIYENVIYIACGKDRCFSGIADSAFFVDVPEGELLESAFLSVLSIIKNVTPDIVLIEPTRSLKVLAGRCAAQMKTSTISNVVSLTSNKNARSMYYGGIVEKTYTSDKALVILCNHQIFESSEVSGTEDWIKEDFIKPSFDIELVSARAIEKTSEDLTKASRIVAVGRAFLEEEDLDLAKEFAAKIKAGLGCTRPIAEELAWMPKETYIGISGLLLKPDVYVGIGTSGQMQHMIGVNKANTIIAINKDRNAPLFKYADYGLIGDIYQVMPTINKELS